VSFDGANGFFGRLGVRLQGRYESGTAVWLPYMRVNLWRDFGGTDNTTFASTTVVPTDVAATAAQFGLGIVGQLSPRGSVFTTLDYTTNVSRAHRSIVEGVVGVRWRW
jgi:outer membrane autotransporter protein